MYQKYIAKIVRIFIITNLKFYLYTSVVYHHNGIPITINVIAKDRAANIRKVSENCNIYISKEIYTYRANNKKWLKISAENDKYAI